MIHELLLTLDKTLPLSPPLVVGAATFLLIFLALWLFGRSRGTILFSAAAFLLVLGLVVGLVGLDKPFSSTRWGDVGVRGGGACGRRGAWPG